MILRPRRERRVDLAARVPASREDVEEYDVVVAHELDRLGRSFADLAGFVEELPEKDVSTS